MFIPKQFRQDDKNMVMEAVKTIRFGVLVVFSEGRFFSSHLPFIIREENNQMILEGHVSRANELWKHAAKENPAMVIFQGEHAYIHPGWYETKKTTGKVVPTWNYQVIHLHGFAEKQEEPGWLLNHLEKLVTHNEADQKNPWKIPDAPQDYIDGLTRAIVGIQFQVERFEAALKMNQHHPQENRLGVIEGLKSSANFHDRAVGDIMQKLEARRDKK
ncbi:MAG: FMN-binding negative transcriptional regulator [Rhodospirillaceae bacterium]|nr:FMN-binding negative transcriptional regulator [Rhodospirillaceae bacterium]